MCGFAIKKRIYEVKYKCVASRSISMRSLIYKLRETSRKKMIISGKWSETKCPLLCPISVDWHSLERPSIRISCCKSLHSTNVCVLRSHIAVVIFHLLNNWTDSETDCRKIHYIINGNLVGISANTHIWKGVGCFVSLAISSSEPRERETTITND